MTLPSEPGPAKAARHYRRAGEYYELAQGFLMHAPQAAMRARPIYWSPPAARCCTKPPSSA